MIFVIKCSNCDQYHIRRITGDLNGKRHICLNCKKGFTIHSKRATGINGNTYGPYQTEEEAISKVAILKDAEQKKHLFGFVTYKVKSLMLVGIRQ